MVEIIESTFVVPSKETPGGKLWLSNFDQVAGPVYICSVFLYKNNEAKDFFSSEVLKAALSKTLVPFYPVAGRLFIGDGSRRAVDCNAEGVLFVVARSDRSSDEIDFQPSPELKSQFVPSATWPSLMLMIQVTYLKCGGVVLGLAANHILIDGQSAVHFFLTWASIARGDLNRIVPPSFDYTPLLARSPPSVTFDYPEYDKYIECKLTWTPDINNSRVTTKFTISNEQISSLKAQCKEGSSTTRVSTFSVVAALVWKCYCIAQDLLPNIETRLMFIADIRKRINPPLPQNFFGNAIIRTSATAQVSELTSSSIQIAANYVIAAVDGITDGYIRSFIDYVEVNKDKGLYPAVELPESVLRIATISGMPVYEADFGWGTPQRMARASAYGNRVVYIIDEPGKDAGVSAFVSLDSAIMEKFEKLFHEELCFNSLQG